MAVSNYVRIPKDHTLVVVLKDSFLMKMAGYAPVMSKDSSLIIYNLCNIIQPTYLVREHAHMNVL